MVAVVAATWAVEVAVAVMAVVEKARVVAAMVMAVVEMVVAVLAKARVAAEIVATKAQVEREWVAVVEMDLVTRWWSIGCT